MKYVALRLTVGNQDESTVETWIGLDALDEKCSVIGHSSYRNAELRDYLVASCVLHAIRSDQMRDYLSRRINYDGLIKYLIANFSKDADPVEKGAMLEAFWANSDYGVPLFIFEINGHVFIRGRVIGFKDVIERIVEMNVANAKLKPEHELDLEKSKEAVAMMSADSREDAANNYDTLTLVDHFRITGQALEDEHVALLDCDEQEMYRRFMVEKKLETV